MYENRYVIWGRIAWGKMREYEVYEDTEEGPQARRMAGPDGKA